MSNTRNSRNSKKSSVATAETAKTAVIKYCFSYTLKDKSLALTDEQRKLFDDIKFDSQHEQYQVMRWNCNHNMITIYDSHNHQLVEVMTARSKRISTRIKFALNDMTTRKSGYGLDATIVLDSVDSQIAYLDKLLKSIDKALAETVKK